MTDYDLLALGLVYLCTFLRYFQVMMGALTRSLCSCGGAWGWRGRWNLVLERRTKSRVNKERKWDFRTKAVESKPKWALHCHQLCEGGGNKLTDFVNNVTLNIT